jgi:hypothetical protein
MDENKRLIGRIFLVKSIADRIASLVIGVFASTLALSPATVKSILQKRINEKEHWKFEEIRCLLDTHCGETEWAPEIEEFEQASRIGNII